MSSPACLQKVEEKSIMAKVEAFLLKNAHIILPILIIILVLLFIVLAAAIIDISSAHTTTSAPVMVESGNYYNHLKNII